MLGRHKTARPEGLFSVVSAALLRAPPRPVPVMCIPSGDRGARNAPRHRNSATCYKFLHTWAISDITAWETAPDVLRHESVKWQGVLRAAGEEPSGRPEGRSMRSGTDFRNGDGAP